MKIGNKYELSNTSSADVLIATSVFAISVQFHLEVNSDEDQISFLQNIMLLRRLQHKHILEILGVCLEGSPGTRAGHEVLMVTGRTHGYVTLQRLLEWCDDNNPDVRNFNFMNVLTCTFQH